MDAELAGRSGDGRKLTVSLATGTLVRDVMEAQLEKIRQLYPQAEILFGASSWTRYEQLARPSANARKMGDGDWYETHNSALIVDSLGRYGLYQKSKLVPGVEMLPYVKVLGPIDEKLLGGVAGRCVGQESVSNLLFRQSLPIGCAVCYESVYGEHCASYVRAGAQLLTVITNDAWLITY